MKPYPSSQPPTVFQRYAARCWQSPRAIGIAVLAAIALMNCARAQVQTAGTVFINVDATTLANGTLTDITNSGSLGGYFEATNSVLVTNMTVGGATSLFLGGIGTTDHLRLVNDIGGALIPPPDGLVGTNATRSIEV